MSDLQELYQEIVMEHNWRPRNFRKLDDATCSANGFNPFCGDTITLYVALQDDQIVDIAFQGSGCAISRASASLMTESVKGKTRAEAEKLFDALHEMLTRGPSEDVEDEEELGDLVALAGVAELPTRVKCATLAWHALKGALAGEERVSTE